MKLLTKKIIAYTVELSIIRILKDASFLPSSIALIRGIKSAKPNKVTSTAI